VTSKCILPGAEQLTAQEQHTILTDTCRRVFTSNDGKVVLNMLLTDLHFFDECRSETETALNNYAKFFIRDRLGVGNTLALSNTVLAEAETADLRKG
jgi:hypothetical protein